MCLQARKDIVYLCGGFKGRGRVAGEFATSLPFSVFGLNYNYSSQK
jgi:hypothetical protein